MSTDVLGSLNFVDTPTVNGSNIMIDAGGVPAFLADITSARPAAGAGPVGRIFLDTTVNRMYRDDGTTWVDLTSVPLIDGTANQITVVDGTNVTASVLSISNNPILPGTASFRPPVGTTAQRPAGVAGDVRFNSSVNEQEQFNGTAWLPFGEVLQVVTGTIPAQSATNSQTPLDATTPLITEGTQIWSQSFTPRLATSKIIISFSVTHAHGTATRTQIQAVFAGNTNIGSLATTCAVASSPYPASQQIVYSPGSTAAITFSCRVGSNGTGTWYINQAGATNTLGGSLVTQFTITEVLQ